MILAYGELAVSYVVTLRAFNLHDMSFIGNSPFWLKYIPVPIVIWYLGAVVQARPDSLPGNRRCPNRLRKTLLSAFDVAATLIRR